MRKNVYRASVFLAVIGLTLMYFSTLYLEYEETDIGDIQRDWAGSNVQVDGEVTRFTRSGAHVFLDLQDSTGEIQVVDFDSELDLREGDELSVNGRVDIYEGNLQVISEEVDT